VCECDVEEERKTKQLSDGLEARPMGAAVDSFVTVPINQPNHYTCMVV
jgi:hypothetical protein